MNFNEIFEEQGKYNEKIFGIDGSRNRSNWTCQYLLGLQSEAGEVLREIEWKKHRNSPKTIVAENVKEEIADLFKYVLSLAYIWDMSPQELLDTCEIKSKILQMKLQMEFAEAPLYKAVAIVDIDGTICNHTESFIKWLQDKKQINASAKNISEILLDSNLSINYPEYYKYKEEFERTGGYKTHSIPYPDMIAKLHNLHIDGMFIIIVTSRPRTKYKRIYNDTVEWLLENDIPFDDLQFVAEERILLAEKLSQDNIVYLIDDDPKIISRAKTAKGDWKIVIRPQKYNSDIEVTTKIMSYEKFMEEPK